MKTCSMKSGDESWETWYKKNYRTKVQETANITNALLANAQANVLRALKSR